MEVDPYAELFWLPSDFNKRPPRLQKRESPDYSVTFVTDKRSHAWIRRNTFPQDAPQRNPRSG